MPVVFVYGFPPGMDVDQFRAEFFEDFNVEEYVNKIDFKKEKIYAFIHTNTLEQGNALINRWNGKGMRNSGENTLQCRLKQEGAQNVRPPNPNYMQRGPNMGGSRPRFGQGMNNNMGGQNAMGGPPNRGPRNNFNPTGGFNPNQNTYNGNQQNSGFQGHQNNSFGQGGMGGSNSFGGPGVHNQNQNKNSRQNSNSFGQTDMATSLGPQKPVLYVYGFPKEMSQDDFENMFLENYKQGHKQTDYFQEKLYCFIHCKNNETCDELIEKWDTKTLPSSDSAVKPLQVRYKGLDSKAMHILNNISPVLWVYGYPKGSTEEQFQSEFLCGMDIDKIDFFEQKLYAFVHCKDWKQCMKLINKWEGKMMNNSKSPLQVRFKNMPTQAKLAGGPNQSGNPNNQAGQTSGFYGGGPGGAHGGSGGHGGPGGHSGGPGGHGGQGSGGAGGGHGGQNSSGGPNSNAMGDMNQPNVYNQTFGNQGQYYHNMNNMGGPPGRGPQSNMNYSNMNNQMSYNRPQNNFNNMNQMNGQTFGMQGQQNRGNWNGPQNGAMGGGQMQMGNFNGPDSFHRNKQQQGGNFNQRPQHQNFNQNQMSDRNFGGNPHLR